MARVDTATDFQMLSQDEAVARFDQAQASTDGGVVLLQALDDQAYGPGNVDLAIYAITHGLGLSGNFFWF